MSSHHPVRIAVCPPIGNRITQARITKSSAIVESHLIQILLTDAEKLAQFGHRKAFHAATSDIDVSVEVVLSHPVFQKSRSNTYHFIPLLRPLARSPPTMIGSTCKAPVG